MADNTARGRFLWHELMTPDTARAHSFYSKALGWKKQSWENDPSYSMFVAPSGPLGGSVAAPSGTPRWVPYIGTTDIDATVEEARRLGGNVTTDVTDIPNAGKYAALVDPQGAAFAVYWSPTEPQPEAPAKHGEFSWHELATTDYRAAFDFYSALFGWDKMAEYDMGPLGMYLIFGRNGNQLGGIFNKGDMGLPGPGYWLGYVRVKDVNQTVSTVKAAGGSLVNGPMEVPGGDWIAQFTDPAGALFAAHVAAADVAGTTAPTAETEAAGAATKKTAQKAATKASKKKAAGTSAKKSAKKVATKSTKKAAAKKKPAKKSKKKARTKKRAAAKAKKRAARRPAQAARKKAAKKGGRKKGGTKKIGRKKRAAKKRATKKARPGKRAAGKRATGKRAAGKRAGRKKR